MHYIFDYKEKEKKQIIILGNYCKIKEIISKEII